MGYYYGNDRRSEREKERVQVAYDHGRNEITARDQIPENNPRTVAVRTI